MSRTADEDVLPEWGTADEGGRRSLPLLDAGRPGPPRRPRWRDVAVVAAGLAALVVAFSLLGGSDGGAGDAATPTTTTTEARRRLAVADRAPPSTALAVEGEQLVLGPLLPVPTGGTVLAALHRGDLRFIEVDTGRVQTFERPVPTAVWGMVEVPGGVMLSGPSGLAVVSRDGTVLWTRAAVDGPVVVTNDPAVVWVGQRGRLVEHRADGSTGRVINASDAGWPVVAVGPGFVVGASGTLVLVDADGGPNRVVGNGVPIAGTGTTLLRMACDAELACPFHLTDVITGHDRPVAGSERTAVDWAFDRTVVSPDGRRIAVRLTSPSGPAVGVIDLDTAELEVLQAPAPNPVAPAFSADGRWLFLLGDVTSPLRAVRIANGEVIDLDVDVATDGAGPVGIVRVPTR